MKNDRYPLVTVYITTYNRKALLKRAVESVLNQTYEKIEIIIADDGSSDGTHQYLKEMSSLGVFKTTVNNSGTSKGACFGRNNAIKLAKGEFITGLDDDDYFEPWRIEKFVELWLKLNSNDQINEVAGLFDSVVELREDGNYKYYESTSVDHATLRASNKIGNQVFTKKEYFLGINGFDEKMPALQDWDTWIRLSKKYGSFINCNTQSYIIDQVHGEVRISEKKSKKIRDAFARLSSKLKPMSYNEKISHLDAMYSYKQLNAYFPDIVTLLLFGKARRVAQVLKRKLVGA
ncbi:glycosyltransferase [Vibrio aquaticus]|uniref:Glycosyltransferase n=1 Tax=Vibrio aquaticus TaxID=2496559 RepID=A0A3S0PQP1_9VIBR|nr:glycosyltransferase [Vibrio aquaticus]RTZ17428.1 glycosyltransferase [Vibrio aquaticus]